MKVHLHILFWKQIPDSGVVSMLVIWFHSSDFKSVTGMFSMPISL